MSLLRRKACEVFIKTAFDTSDGLLAGGLVGGLGLGHLVEQGGYNALYLHSALEGLEKAKQTGKYTPDFLRNIKSQYLREAGVHGRLANKLPMHGLGIASIGNGMKWLGLLSGAGLIGKKIYDHVS